MIQIARIPFHHLNCRWSNAEGRVVPHTQESFDALVFGLNNGRSYFDAYKENLERFIRPYLLFPWSAEDREDAAEYHKFASLNYTLKIESEYEGCSNDIRMSDASCDMETMRRIIIQCLNEDWQNYDGTPFFSELVIELK